MSFHFRTPKHKLAASWCCFINFPRRRRFPVLSAGAQENEVLQPLTQRVQELEGELAITRDYLYRTNQEKESANEQLQAANEELQSSERRAPEHQ
jgi:hypothetical protein